jgi:hypothetical protein
MITAPPPPRTRQRGVSAAEDNGADHRHQQHHRNHLERHQVLRVEQPAHRLGVAHGLVSDGLQGGGGAVSRSHGSEQDAGREQGTQENSSQHRQRRDA